MSKKSDKVNGYVFLSNPFPQQTNMNMNKWAIKVNTDSSQQIEAAARHLFKQLSSFLIFDHNKSMDKFLFQVCSCNADGVKLAVHPFDGMLNKVDNGFVVKVKQHYFPSSIEKVELSPEHLYQSPLNFISNGVMGEKIDTDRGGGGRCPGCNTEMGTGGTTKCSVCTTREDAARMIPWLTGMAWLRTDSEMALNPMNTLLLPNNISFLYNGCLLCPDMYKFMMVNNYVQLLGGKLPLSPLSVPDLSNMMFHYAALQSLSSILNPSKGTASGSSST